MFTARSHSKGRRGITTIEVVLAISLAGLFAAMFTGALVAGREGIRFTGDRARALLLAEEGIEAVRNIRDASFANLAGGVYGATTTGGIWSLVGGTESAGKFTRTITLAEVNARTFEASVTVAWDGNSRRPGTVTLTSRITGWKIGDWQNASALGGLDLDAPLTGTADGFKIQTQGNYAYVVRNGGNPDFIILDIRTPSVPLIVGRLNLPGLPRNIAVSGMRAYVTSDDNANELIEVDVSDPFSPRILGTYNAPGNADGLGVFTDGSFVYFTRVSSTERELVMIDIATRAVRQAELGATASEVFVTGGFVYIASLGNDREFQIVDLGTLALTSRNLPGNDDALAIGGSGTTILLGRANGEVYLIDIAANPVPPPPGAPWFIAAGGVQDIALGNDNTFAFLGTSSAASEFYALDLLTPATPLIGTLNIPGAGALNGVSYHERLDRIFGASALDAAEFVVIAPGP